MFIAQDAWIGCASSLVFGGKTVDDLLLKCLRGVNQMEWDAKMVADGAHVGRRARSAALEQVLRGRKAVLRPQLERDTDYIVALRSEEHRVGKECRSRW